MKFIVILWAELGGGQMAIWAREASSKWHYCCCLLHTISVSGLFLKKLLEMHTNCSGQFVLFPSSRFKRPCMRCEFTGAQKFYAKLFEICNAHITVNDLREFEGGWEGLSCTKLGKANSEEERAVKLQMQQGGGLWVLDLISNHTTLTTGELGGC